jgi:hypothetical protein
VARGLTATDILEASEGVRLSEGGGMAEIEHDIDALEAKIRTAIEGVKNLDNGLLEGCSR